MPIPDIFSARNKELVYGDAVGAKNHYNMFTGGKAKASQCAACGQCEAACPQHIQIMDKLKEIAQAYE